MLTNDLNNTGLFKVIPGSSGTGKPDFGTAKGLGAHAQVSGGVTGSGASVRVEMRLWDVLAHQQIQGTAYTTTSANWRRIAHIMGDVIYERMLGEKGYFDTRIAFISRSGPRAHQRTRLAIMDQDGANSRMLSAGTVSYTPLTLPKISALLFSGVSCPYLNLRTVVIMYT